MLGFNFSKQKKGENMFDLIEIGLIRFWLICCKISHTKSSFGWEIKKGLTYAKFDLNVFDLSTFNFNCT